MMLTLSAVHTPAQSHSARWHHGGWRLERAQRLHRCQVAPAVTMVCGSGAFSQGQWTAACAADAADIAAGGINACAASWTSPELIAAPRATAGETKSTKDSAKSVAPLMRATRKSVSESTMPLRMPGGMSPKHHTIHATKHVSTAPQRVTPDGLAHEQMMLGSAYSGGAHCNKLATTNKRDPSSFASCASKRNSTPAWHC